MTTAAGPIFLVESDALTIELVQRAVGRLNEAHPLVLFSDPGAVRRYLVDGVGRPAAMLLNGRREGALSLMLWINNATDTPVIYFGPALGLPHFYSVDSLAEPLTEDVVTDALNGVLADRAQNWPVPRPRTW
jgi:hypothetical protein